MEVLVLATGVDANAPPLGVVPAEGDVYEFRGD